MDRILIEKYIGKMSKENENPFYAICMNNSQKKVEYKNKGNYIYSPNDDLELILESEKTKDSLKITNFDMHHKSDSIWKFKIMKDMKLFENTYIVSDISSPGTYTLRLINTICLGKDIKEGSLIEASICGFVIAANLYPDDEAFKKTLPASKKGEKVMSENGSLMPIHLVNNHNVSNGIIKDEKFKLDDILMTVKGPLKNVEKYDLEINGNKFLGYFKAIIDTSFGELPIIFNGRVLPEGTQGFNPGYIMVAEILLSGDVCINKYRQYRHKSDYKEVIEEFASKSKK